MAANKYLPSFNFQAQTIHIFLLNQASGSPLYINIKTNLLPHHHNFPTNKRIYISKRQLFGGKLAKPKRASRRSSSNERGQYYRRTLELQIITDLNKSKQQTSNESASFASHKLNPRTKRTKREKLYKQITPIPTKNRQENPNFSTIINKIIANPFDPTLFSIMCQNREPS